MKAITKFLVGGVGIVGLAAAAPAAAQYMPGYGSPYGYGVPGTGYGAPGYGSPYGYSGYGYNVQGGSQVAVSQCSAAVQQRLGYGGYGYAGGYGQNLGITSVEIRNGGGYRVRGVAGAAGYGGMAFSCRTDPRGYVVDVDLGNRGRGYNGYNGYYGSNHINPYNPYSVYGYQRY